MRYIFRASVSVRIFHCPAQKRVKKAGKERCGGKIYHARSEINSVDPDWKSTYNRKSFFRVTGERKGRSRQMEGKNVEENKARDKWCSLCVSCGERPRLINRHIDTRYISPKEKTKDGRLSLLEKKRNRDYKSRYNNRASLTIDLWQTFYYCFHYFCFFFIARNFPRFLSNW